MADLVNSTTVPGASNNHNVIRHPRELVREMREKVAEAAQRLIDLLDEIDADPDYEPELSQTTGSDRTESQVLAWRKPAVEGDSSEDLEHTGDEFEPSLGSSDRNVNQTAWSQGAPGDVEAVDLEEQCDDEGIDSDSEPDMIADNGDCGTAPFALDQSGSQWAYGSGSDKPRPPEPPTRIEQRPLGEFRGPDGTMYHATALVTVPVGGLA